MSPLPGLRPVSLLLVCYSYPPGLGGSEIEAQRVSAALIRRGHRVTVLCAGGPPMPDVAEWVDPAGVPVRLFGRRFSGRLRDYVYSLGVVWTFIRRRRKYDFVYFLMTGLHLAAGLPVARLLRKPVVMKISGSGLITGLLGIRLGRLELRWLRRWAHRVMILNEGMAREAAQAGFEPQQLLWMPNPVDTEDFAPCAAPRRAELRAALGLAPDATAVFFAGRLAPEKELPSLIDAFVQAAVRHPEAVLIVVGDGPLRAELEERARDWMARGAIRFTGRVPVEQVRDWLQAVDIFALVSSNEGFACSLTEAMSAGLPSVVSDIPANRQLIDDGVHGLYASVCDSVSIAAALEKLLEDPELRTRMGAAARRRVVENYSTDIVVDRYESLFAEMQAVPGRPER